MQSIIMALPILPGRTESGKTFLKTVKEEKWNDYERVSVEGHQTRSQVPTYLTYRSDSSSWFQAFARNP